MTDYSATSRTRYTNVRDPKKFKEWVDSLPQTVLIEQNREDGKLYGLLFDNQIPAYREDDGIRFDSGGFGYRYSIRNKSYIS